MAEMIPQSSGVQELIQRLREQGVEEGQQEAERVVEEAHRRAAQIITTAKAEGEDVKAKARSEAESERASAETALRTAYRAQRTHVAKVIAMRIIGHTISCTV